MDSKTLTRFIPKMDQNGPDECWPWQASRNACGYGTFRNDGSAKLAHRLAYELWVGPIPEGLVVRHICENRPCCNPRHLRLGTQRENMHDRVRSGWNPAPPITEGTRVVHRSKTFAEAVWQRVVKGDGCWSWTGEMQSDGYARINFRGYPSKRAAKAVYELVHGQILPGIILRTGCKNVGCVRPDHMYLAERAGVLACPLEEALWPRVDKSGDCWLWMGCRDKNGYGMFENAGKHCRSHRVAYELTNGPVPEGLMVLHSCDNPPCCNPAHLRAGTAAENTREMIERGRMRHNAAKGERAGQAKLKDQQVREIRSRYAAGGITHRELSEQYGISHVQIGFVIKRKTWKHVT